MASSSTPEHQQLAQAVNDGTSAINAASHAAKLVSNNIDKPVVIHLNSGAIYGKQTSQLRNEIDLPLTTTTNPYIESKITIDSILSKAESQGLIKFQSPRLFAVSHHPLSQP